MPPVNLLGDFGGGGLLLALGVVTALYERERSGLGQVLDVAMVDGASLLTAFLHGLHAQGGWPGPRGGNSLDGGAAFYDTYATADGRYVSVGAIEPQFFAELLRLLDLTDEELPDHLDPRSWPVLRARLAEVFLTRTRAEWAELFDGTDACVAPVLSPWEAAEHPHHVARHAFVEIGGVVQPAPAPRFGRTPARDPVAKDAGGRDVTATLGSWGFAASEVDALLNEAALG